jgi:hypothetical protein
MQSPRGTLGERSRTSSTGLILPGRLAKLEEEIAQFEARQKDLQELLPQDSGGDWQKLHALVNEDQELRGRLERRYREWEPVTYSLGNEAK